MAPPDPKSTLVSDTEINNAPDDVVRATLVALCRNDAALRARVSAVFRVAAKAGQNKRKAQDGEAVDEQELPEARRRKLEGLHVCIMCEKAYLESENHRKACWHHPDVAEVNDEATIWEDDDGWGERDTEDNRVDYPEGFIFLCCDNNLTSTGCRWGKHYASTEQRDDDPQADEPVSDPVVEIGSE